MRNTFQLIAFARTCFREAQRSGLAIVIGGYAGLILLDIATFLIGPAKAYSAISTQSWGILASFIIFDSWPTVLGLVGSIAIFALVLVEVRGAERVRLSLFFVGATLVNGSVAGVLWNRYFNTSGLIPYGSSSVALSAEGVLLAVCTFGLVRTLRQATWRIGPWTRRRCYLSMLTFCTVISSTLFYILALQPIFVATNEYNWRVHEISFALGALTAATFIIIAVPGLGLDSRSIPLDERLMSFRFYDINDALFQGRLPTYRLIFKDLPRDLVVESHPTSMEIWVNQKYRNSEFEAVSHGFNRALSDEMKRLDWLLYQTPGPI